MICETWTVCDIGKCLEITLSLTLAFYAPVEKPQMRPFDCPGAVKEDQKRKGSRPALYEKCTEGRFCDVATEHEYQELSKA